METVDARISKLSIEELQTKLEEAQKQVNVYQSAINERKDAEIQRKLDELKALGWAPGSKVTKITRQRDPNKPCSVCGQTGHDARRHRKENIAKKKAS